MSFFFFGVLCEFQGVLMIDEVREGVDTAINILRSNCQSLIWY
jgi:hypothetical protein